MPIIFVSEIDHFGAQSGRGSIFIRRLELLRVLAMSYKALLGSVAVAVAVAVAFTVAVAVAAPVAETFRMGGDHESYKVL